MNIYPHFSAALDDVYQNETYLSLMGVGEEHRLDEKDVKVVLGLSVIFGHTLVTPARFVIDHGPLIGLCGTDDWMDVVSRRLAPASPQHEWKEFIDRSGGTPDWPPLSMSTDPEGENNQLIREVWNGGNGYLESRRLWKKTFGNAVWIADELDKRGVQLWHHTIKPGNYNRLLRTRFEAGSLPPEVEQLLDEAVSRGAALELIRKDYDTLEPGLRVDLTRAAIAARQDDFIDTAFQPEYPKASFGEPTGVSSRAADASIERQFKVSAEVPVLSEILKGSAEPEILKELEMGQAAALDRFRLARAAFQEALHARRCRLKLRRRLSQLCTNAAAVLPGKYRENSVKVGGVVGGSLALHTALQLLRSASVLNLAICGAAGGILMLLDSVPPTHPLWSHLHCDLRLRSELLRANRAHNINWQEK
jgi:hypothetical protein